MEPVVVLQRRDVFVLERLPAEKGDGLASPLPHPKVRVLRHDQQVARDATPDNVDPTQVDL